MYLALTLLKMPPMFFASVPFCGSECQDWLYTVQNNISFYGLSGLILHFLTLSDKMKRSKPLFFYEHRYLESFMPPLNFVLSRLNNLSLSSLPSSCSFKLLSSVNILLRIRKFHNQPITHKNSLHYRETITLRRWTGGPNRSFLSLIYMNMSIRTVNLNKNWGEKHWWR